MGAAHPSDAAGLAHCVLVARRVLAQVADGADDVGHSLPRGAGLEELDQQPAAANAHAANKRRWPRRGTFRATVSRAGGEGQGGGEGGNEGGGSDGAACYAPHASSLADGILIGGVVVAEVPQRPRDDHHVLLALALQVEQRDERRDASRLTDRLAVGAVGEGEVLEGAGGLGGALADGLGREQLHQLLDAAGLADCDLVRAVRVARQPAQRVRGPRGRVGAGALCQEVDERMDAVGFADGVLIGGVVVRQVAERSRRVRRRLDPIVRDPTV